MASWSRASFSRNDALGQYHRLAYAYWNLANIGQKVTGKIDRKSLNEAIHQFKRMESGNVAKDYGILINQIYLNTQLGNESQIDLLRKKILAHGPKNRLMLYSGLAHAYLYYQKDCEKVLKYSSKMPLESIPVETERINMTSYRIRCHQIHGDKKSAQKDYDLLIANTSKEIRKAFSEKMDKIQKIMDEL